MTERLADRDWTAWPLEKWNDALVDAVFLTPDGASRSITRIDATSSFLARAVGAAQSDEEAVRASFIRSFLNGLSVRFFFGSWHQFEPWKPSAPDLPFFAQLYLSVMVAGADENTHDIGNFRARLAKMLDAPEAAHLQLDGLPVLWRAAAQWTHKTVRLSIRRLVLPHPGHETLIGYSKRLAFPGFRDQKRLAELLRDRDLTAQSPAVRIIQAVSRCLDQFSTRFQEEFGEFNELYRRSEHSRALASPFWGALQDISWAAAAACNGRSERGKFVLELDVVYTHSPALLLRSDSPLSLRHLPWRSTRRGFYRDGRPYELYPDGDDRAPSPDSLHSPSARAFFGRSRAWQCLNNGCVAFAQDEFGAWIDASGLSEGDPFWLLLSRTEGERVRLALASAGCKPAICRPFSNSRAWMLVGQLTLSEPLRSLLESCIDDPLFEHRLVAPRIRVRGGLQLPEGYLFLPGCAPCVSLSDAASMRWSAGAGDSPGGELVPVQGADATTFVFAADDLRERLCASQRIDIIALDGEGDTLDHTQLRTTTECSDWTLKQPADRNRWRETGDAGDLTGLEDVGRTSAQRSAGHVEVRPLVTSPERFEGPREADVDAMPAPWRDMLEILTATFTRAAALPAQDMVELVRQAWDIDGRRAWAAIQDFVDNGLIEHVFNRHWHGSMFLACAARAEIVAVADHWQFRVIGLAPAALRREIHARTQVMGIRLSVLTDPTGTTCGALQAQLPSLACAEGLCRDLEMAYEVYEQGEREQPFAPWARLLVTRELEPKGERSVWSPERRSFLGGVVAAKELPQLEQWRQEGRQPIFVLRTQRHTWSTHSRIWALLAHDALAGSTLGAIGVDGSLRLAHPMLSMPPKVAREVLRSGGGVCYRDEIGRRIYPAGMLWMPALMCAAWVLRHVERVESDVARQQLRTALAGATRVPTSMLRRYWSRSGRDS